MVNTTREMIEDYLDYRLTTMNKKHFAEYTVVPPAEESEKKPERPPPNRWCFYLGVFLVFNGFGSIIGSTFFYNVMRQLNLEVKPDNLKWALWKENIVPFTMDIYFFNWTNPQDILDPNIKPKFEEVGPYKFIQVRRKMEEVWNDNGTITFKQRRVWTFSEDSPRKLNEMITTVNAIALSASYRGRLDTYFQNMALSTAMTAIGVKMHVTKTAGELIYQGYEDKLMKLGQRAAPFVSQDVPPMNNFSWFYGWNNSVDFHGIFNVDKDLPTVGKVRSWNYKTRVPQYPDSCADIKGYFGDNFPIDMKKDDFPIFATEVCRDIPFQFEQEKREKGLPCYKFTVGDKFLDNGTVYPENKCMHGRNGESVPSGSTNISACWMNSPVFVSLPHFHGSDPIYRDSIEGMKPDKDKHEFYITIQPDTGIVVDAAIRVQFSFMLQPNSKVWLFKNAPKIHLPVLWFEQRSGMPQKYVIPVHILLNTRILVICYGCIIILAGFFIVYREVYKKKYLSSEGYAKLRTILFNRKCEA